MIAIYARQSVDKKDSISIETQIELCAREIPPECAYRVYADRGFSGGNINRPQFQQLLADIRQGEIQRIVTYRLDRISRSVLDFAGLIDFFGRYQVSFNSTQEKFDTGTPIGRAMLNIVMTFAQLERETIQQRIRDNYYARGEKGMYLGGPAPYGFQKVTDRTPKGKHTFLKPDGGAETLCRLYRLYGDEGRTLGEIARLLNTERISSPGGAQWDSGKISRVLRNPVSVQADTEVYRYYRLRGCRISDAPADFAAGRGCYLYGKRTGGRKYTDVTDHTLTLAPHAGIVPADLFLRCQRRLDGNTQVDNRRRSRITWLTGLLKCAECGHSVVPKDSSGGRYRYLYCTGQLNLHCCKAGNLGTLREVEDAVARRIFCWAEQYAAVEAPQTEKGGETALLRCRLLETEEKIRRLVDLAAESADLTASYLDEKITELENTRRILTAERENCSGKNPARTKNGIRDLPLFWNTLNLSQKNEIASLLISRVRLSGKRIEIVWKYGFDLEESREEVLEQS